jgi:hypothetical protein
VLFESLDGAFISISTMAVRQHQLVLHVIGGEKILQSDRWLIIKSLEVWLKTIDREFLMGVIICFDPFSGGPRCHWDDFNIVAVINVAYHDI